MSAYNIFHPYHESPLFKACSWICWWNKHSSEKLSWSLNTSLLSLFFNHGMCEAGNTSLVKHRPLPRSDPTSKPFCKNHHQLYATYPCTLWRSNCQLDFDQRALKRDTGVGDSVWHRRLVAFYHLHKPSSSEKDHRDWVTIALPLFSRSPWIIICHEDRLKGKPGTRFFLQSACQSPYQR